MLRWQQLLNEIQETKEHPSDGESECSFVGVGAKLRVTRLVGGASTSPP